VSLARRDSRVQYDPKSQSARVDVPIAFSDKTATLTAEDKLKLDELAKLLKSTEARELRVMVASSAAARAQAVTDYLDRHGIAEERLAVSTGGKGTSASGSGVEFYLVQSDVTVVGWEPPPTVRR
jgi:outer membrane protein OmpA-like peptidoglycan-associated protein